MNFGRSMMEENVKSLLDPAVIGRQRARGSASERQ
jgi:hypothetical protein